MADQKSSISATPVNLSGQKIAEEALPISLVRASPVDLTGVSAAKQSGQATGLAVNPTIVVLAEEVKVPAPVVSDATKAPSKPNRPPFPTGVFIGELRRHVPDLSEEIWSLACEVVKEFRVITGEQRFILFGVKYQEEFGAKINEMLSVISNPSVERAKKAVDKIAEIVKELDCKQLLSEKKGGLIDSFRGLFFKEITKEYFDGRCREVDVEIIRCRSYLDPLLKLKDRIDADMDMTPFLLKRLEAVKVAGLFLIAGFKVELEKMKGQADKKPDIIRLEGSIRSMEARLESVALTNIGLLQSYEQARIGRTTILNIVRTIQNVVLVMIPAWKSCYYNVLTLLSGRRKTTAGNESVKQLIDMQTKIIENLVY